MTLALRKSFGQQPHEAKVEDGLYKVKLMTIGEPKMYPGYQGGPEQEKSRFVFEITKDFDSERVENGNDYRGEELSVLVNINGVGPRSTLYKIVLAITGQQPEELGEFDLYEMIGQECKVSVVVQFSDDGKNSYANIKEFMPLRPVRPVAPAAPSAPQQAAPRVAANSQVKRPVAAGRPAQAPRNEETVESAELDF